MSQPLAIDLFCGLGGWTEGLLAEGYHVFGFDCERHAYGSARYPAQLVIQDVLTIHGSQFKDATLIVASPPCQEYSYMAMPWSRAKQIEREYRDGTRDRNRLTALFDACFRIQREANDAVRHYCKTCGVFMLSHHAWTNQSACSKFIPNSRYIPLVVENVRGAEKWVGRARTHYGSFYLWGDVPALMPITSRLREPKVQPPGGQPNNYDKPGYIRVPFNGNPKQVLSGDGVKFSSSGAAWFDGKPRDKMLGDKGPAAYGSKSNARKAASAHIAKIPLPLSRHIARAWRPTE